ncbi:MAG TPA: DUF5666 domain-containing protein [Myxococcota bacterium]
MMRRIAPILLILASACGGGGTDVASGGIGGTGISSGPITGIGSFFVTGTEWSVDPASGQVFLDGEAFSEIDLELGMVVTVEGTRAADGTGTATRVEFDDDVEGPLDPNSYDPATCGVDETCFTVFGRTFVADRNTIYSGTTFDGFRLFFVPSVGAVDAVVEVSGLPDLHPTHGPVIRATRIEVKEPSGPVTGVTRVELEGTVENLNGQEGPFDIGPVTVRQNAPGCLPTDKTDLQGPLANGDRIEVKGRFIATNEVCAEVIEGEDALPDTEEFEIEGIVTEVTSNASFRLADVAVNAAGAQFEPANLQVQEGMRLEVEGALAGGVLVADEVKQRGEVEIQAVVTGLIDGGFTVLGRGIFIDAATEIDAGPVGTGDFVEVHAVDDGAGGLTATKVEVEPGSAADRVRVKGRVDQGPSLENNRRIRVAGIFIRADDGTRCRRADGQILPCGEFFGSVRVGDEVQATDTVGPFGAFDVANDLEFED